jgi:hypothetical protein
MPFPLPFLCMNVPASHPLFGSHSQVQNQAVEVVLCKYLERKPKAKVLVIGSPDNQEIGPTARSKTLYQLLSTDDHLSKVPHVE